MSYVDKSPPDAVVVKLFFDRYHSKGSGKSTPNDIRRWLMGLKKAPIKPFTSAVAGKIGKSEEVLIPYCFCLVKDPLAAHKSGSKNAAIGAVAIFQYSGTFAEFEAVCRAITETLNSSRKIRSIAFSDYEVFAAKSVTDGKGNNPKIC